VPYSGVLPILPFPMKNQLSRRSFARLGGGAAAFSLIPGRVLGANEKVNVAFIGCGGMGNSDAKSVNGTGLVNVVALCDVAMGTGHTADTEKLFPQAKKFRDFREMFDKMGDQIDACTVATPDHSHFPISMLAMSLGKHIYVEKPLAHTFQEIELMMAAEKKYGVSCQMGNQGHSGGNYHQFKLWKEEGVIKDVTKVTAFMNSGRRWHGWKFDDFPQAEPMPEGMDWDTWLCGRPEVGFSKRLHPGDWRGWYQFGNGAFGDWGPHILDTVHRFLELGMPERITAVHRKEPNDLFYPLESTIQFDFPARGDMPAVEITWYDGVDNKPERPEELDGERQLGNAGKVIYSKDLTFMGGTHGDTLRVIPEEKMREVGASLPRVEGRHSNHQMNFVLGAKGEEQTRSSFDVSGPLSQVFCLGVIAQRLGGTLEFDRETKRFTNNDRANELLAGLPPRPGWEQFYSL